MESNVTDTTQHTWLGLLLAIIAVAIVIWTMPVYPIVPHGIVLPTSQLKSPYQGIINVYTPLNAPFVAENLGVLNLMYHTESAGPLAQQTIMDAAKKQAAAAGGNAVQLVFIGHTLPNIPSELAALIIKANVLLTN